MRALLLGAAVVITACSTPDEECPSYDTTCMPQYEPTFANIHARTVATSCATGGGSCHASAASSGGFSLADIDDAYDELSQRATGKECSVLIARLTSDDATFQMPPGKPLSDGERCAIVQWVDAGSPR